MEGGMGSFIILLVMFGLFWVLMIYPQQKQLKARNAMLDALKVGDKIETVGRVFGEIVNVDGQMLTVNIAVASSSSKKIEILIHREGVARLINDDAGKSDKKDEK